MNLRNLPRVCSVLAVAAGFIAASGIPALAQAPDPHEAQPERPSVATHAGTVAPGWLEFETGIEVDRFDDHSHGGSSPFVFKVGLAPRLQLTLQTPIVHPPGTATTAFGDVSAGVKWRVLEDSPVLGDVAILPSLKFANASSTSGTGSGTTDFGLLFISSHAFGPVSMDLNAGYVRRSGDGSNAPRNAELWTVSLGGSAHGALGWGAEVYGYPGTAGPAGSAPIVALLAGPTFQVRKWLVLDTGFIAPLTGPQPRAFYAGIVYNVGKLRP